MTPDPISVSTPSEDFACELCSDTGWVEVKPGFVRRCSCLGERVIRAALPVKYHQAYLADFVPPISDLATNWLKDRRQGMLILGPTGSGKTHLACALVRELFEMGERPVFLRAADLYLEVRRSYGEWDGDETAIIGAYSSAPVLVLDDIGAGSLSDHERRILLEVVDRRGNTLLPTVVTTNMGLADIAKLMDERISSRLRDYLAMPVLSPDQRGIPHSRPSRQAPRKPISVRPAVNPEVQTILGKAPVIMKRIPPVPPPYRDLSPYEVSDRKQSAKETLAQFIQRRIARAEDPAEVERLRKTLETVRGAPDPAIVEGARTLEEEVQKLKESEASA